MTKTYTLKDGRQVKVTAKNKRESNKWGMTHFAYTIVIEFEGKTFKDTFHDSHVNWRNGKGATKEMIDDAVDCTIEDADAYDFHRGLDDFINAFGYDSQEKEGAEVYYACKKTCEALMEMFTYEELSELTELTNSR
jgi:hypothetical protein